MLNGDVFFSFLWPGWFNPNGLMELESDEEGIKSDQLCLWISALRVCMHVCMPVFVLNLKH